MAVVLQFYAIRSLKLSRYSRKDTSAKKYKNITLQKTIDICLVTVDIIVTKAYHITIHAKVY